MCNLNEVCSFYEPVPWDKASKKFPKGYNNKFLQWILATRQSETFELQRDFLRFVDNTLVSILLFFELQGNMKPLRISRQ